MKIYFCLSEKIEKIEKNVKKEEKLYILVSFCVWKSRCEKTGRTEKFSEFSSLATFGRCYDNKKMQLESQFHELTNRFHHYPVLFCSLFCISSMFSFYLTYDFLYTNTFLQLINDIRKYSHNIFKVFRESEISF
jgi:hypothetical protein